jgi:hypothetical protein
VDVSIALWMLRSTTRRYGRHGDLTCDVAQLDFVEELIDIRLRPVSHQQRKSDGYCDSNLTFRLQVQDAQTLQWMLTRGRIPPRSSRSFTWRAEERRRTDAQRVAAPSNHGGYIKYCDLSIVGVIDHSLAPKRGMAPIPADPISDIDLDTAAG